MSPVRLGYTNLAPSPCLAKTQASNISSWATIVITNAAKVPTTTPAIQQRSKTPSTTSDTGLRREQVGGIIIGICLGLLLVLSLCWVCFGRRRQQHWYSDSDSEGFVPPQSPLPPSHVPPPTIKCKSEPVHVPPPKQLEARLDSSIAEKSHGNAATTKSFTSKTAYAKSDTRQAIPKEIASPKQPQTRRDPTLADEAHDDAIPEPKTFKKGGLGYIEGDTVKKVPVAWVKTSRKSLGLGPDEINKL
jgi:hypothetical protein